MTATEVLKHLDEASIIDKAVKEATERLAKEIDFQVLTKLLVESGWIKVVLKPMAWEKGYAIDQWVDANCKGSHNTLGLVWVFERSSDAVNFTLKWAS
jgi:hypothetical protein